MKIIKQIQNNFDNYKESRLIYGAETPEPIENKAENISENDDAISNEKEFTDLTNNISSEIDALLDKSVTRMPALTVTARTNEEIREDDKTQADIRKTVENKIMPKEVDLASILDPNNPIIKQDDLDSLLNSTPPDNDTYMASRKGEEVRPVDINNDKDTESQTNTTLANNKVEAVKRIFNETYPPLDYDTTPIAFNDKDTYSTKPKDNTPQRRGGETTKPVDIDF